ncbi:MAG: SMC-Scp complex subunit ScpB [Candidatus Aenigmatarchaeota archaeon]
MNKKALVEAALFVSDKPLSVEKLSKVLGISSKEIEEILAEMQAELQSNERGIELVSTPEGFEFRIKQPYREKVASLAPFADLSDGMMRTLAIVALKQPIKQSTIVKYQGNKAYNYIAALEKKGLVKTEKFGRTKLVSTTSEFEKYFGKSKEEIKRILVESEKKA